MANPYILPSITGNIRAGVNRFLTGKAATADEERKRKLAIEQDNQKFDRDMALMRFRSDLNTQGEIGRLRAADQLNQQSWQEGINNPARFKTSASGVAATPDMAEPGFDPIETPAQFQPEGWRRTQANLKQQQAEGLATHRADEQIRVKKVTPARSGGGGGGGHRGGGGGGGVEPQDTSGMTTDAKRRHDALMKQNQSLQAQASNMDETDPGYKNVLTTIQQNSDAAQRLVNNPASWASPAAASPSAPAPVSKERANDPAVAVAALVSRAKSLDELYSLRNRVSRDNRMTPQEREASLAHIRDEIMVRGGQ
jgi:hypothetical protein